MMGGCRRLWGMERATCFHPRNALAGCSIGIMTDSVCACRLKGSGEGWKDCINFRPVAYRGIGGMFLGATPGAKSH